LNIEVKRREEVQVLLGRQVKTSFGEIVDLLTIAPDGSLVLIELKRERRCVRSWPRPLVPA
jgi:limonene-1,2-epoxide hydrolase